MFCNACGKQIPDDARLCSYCGVAVAGAAPPMTRRELVRPRQGRMIAGVCAGLAQHFGWSVSMVRLIWLLMLLLAGTGVLLYIVLWIVMPNE